jgi:anaerobic magnesium-protoporphyrin IX monomethyl ester cyclase
MAANTYRGSRLRNVLGLEDDRQAFARYKQIRRQEREYV